MRLQKEQQIDNKKNKLKVGRKQFRKSQSHTMAIKICSTALSVSTDIVSCNLSVMKLGNK